MLVSQSPETPPSQASSETGIWIPPLRYRLIYLISDHLTHIDPEPSRSRLPPTPSLTPAPDEERADYAFLSGQEFLFGWSAPPELGDIMENSNFDTVLASVDVREH